MAWYAPYVVELSDEAKLGPKVDPAKPYLYVGISAQSPERRFQTHKAGGRTAASVVAKYGLHLRQDLLSGYRKANGQAEARELELRVANDLRALGYIVYSGAPGMGWDWLRARP